MMLVATLIFTFPSEKQKNNTDEKQGKYIVQSSE